MLRHLFSPSSSRLCVDCDLITLLFAAITAWYSRQRHSLVHTASRLCCTLSCVLFSNLFLLQTHMRSYSSAVLSAPTRSRAASAQHSRAGSTHSLANLTRQDTGVMGFPEREKQQQSPQSERAGAGRRGSFAGLAVDTQATTTSHSRGTTPRAKTPSEYEVGLTCLVRNRVPLGCDCLSHCFRIVCRNENSVFLVVAISPFLL